jgi:hypothetical protein
MEILVDGIHPMSLLWRACSMKLMPLMEILVGGIHPMSLLCGACSMNVPSKPSTSHPAVVRSTTREEMTSKVKRGKDITTATAGWLVLSFKGMSSIEHVTHASHLGCIPSTEISIKGTSILEHVLHSSDTGCIPST